MLDVKGINIGIKIEILGWRKGMRIREERSWKLEKEVIRYEVGGLLYIIVYCYVYILNLIISSVNKISLRVNYGCQYA